MTGKNFLAVIISVILITYLSSCGKAADTTPKITGSWDQVGIHQIDQTDHVTTGNNFQNVPPGFYLLQIGTDGSYMQYPQGSSPTSGTYTYRGGVLTLIDAAHPAGAPYHVDSLSSYYMILHKMLDTVSIGPPLMTKDVFLSFSK